MQFLILVLLGFGFINFVFAEESSWVLKKNQQGIEVYTRKVEGSPILEHKADSIVDVPLVKVVGLFEDEKRMTQWYYQCVRSELIQDEGAQQKVIYFVLHLPWPVSERDAVLRRIKTEDLINKTISYSIAVLPDKLPLRKGKIRMLSVKSVWRFTSLPDGRTAIYFQQHANPGGSIPAFLVNQLAVDIPFNSLKNLRRLLVEGNK